MRCVVSPPVLPSLRPAGDALDGVRRLGNRFPEARVREVPVVRAAELDARADSSGATRVWLALEALQVTGSFKVRGALVAVASRMERKHVAAAGAGNHGVAVAYAACVLGVGATVVVPRTASDARCDKIRRFGAEVVVAPTDGPDDAEALAEQIASTHGAAFIANDDLDVALGSGSSLGFEIVRALGGVPERVLVPVRSGALASGLAWAFDADVEGPPERVVWGVQSEAACALATWLEGAGAIAPAEARSPPGASRARGSVETLARARAALAGVAVVDESQVAVAMLHAYREMGLVVEGSAALALAPVLSGLPEPLRGGDLVIVLTGRNVDPDYLDALIERGNAQPIDTDSRS
jgi:threonine dehydratase